ncbi:hypothetical protein [Fluviispira vulneris]|uniref:hypothetical protein n=1 Tax=Fluviispira vulneris TaxID=2763012 RepID=UPI00164441C5|nr:hypothetical protein [Fluviispira vulneris]
MKNIREYSNEELLEIVNNSNKKPANNNIENMSDDDLYRIAGVKPENKTNTLEALLLGAADGATFGFTDEINGAVGGLGRGIGYLWGNGKKDKSLLDAIQNGYIKDRDVTRWLQKNAEAEHPVANFTGGIAAAIPSGVGRGSISLARMAAEGAVGGFGGSEGDTWERRAQDTALGAGVGGALGVAARGVGNIPRALDRFKKNQTLKALGATRSDFTKMGENADGIAQFALDNGYINPLKTLTHKEELATKNLKNIGMQLSDARGRLPVVSTDDVLAAVDKRASHLTPGLNLDAKHVNQVNNLRDDIKLLSNANNNMDFKTLVDLKSKIGRETRDVFGNAEKSKIGLDLGRSALRDVEIKTAATAEPQYAKMLSDYSNTTMVDELLSRKASMGGNSAIGFLGAAGAAAGAAAEGKTGGAIGALSLIPAMRTKAGETAALTINAAQKSKILKALSTSGIDPRIAAYLLSRGINR